jgi:small subunit ribosomal protein S8
MLNALQNASMTKKSVVEIFYTKECEEIAQILKKRGFLSEVKVFKPAKSTYKMLHMEIAQTEGEFNLTQARRVSKPGRRIYQGFKELRTRAGKYGVLIVSTPKGVLDSMDARKKKVGGEVICEVM